MPARHRPSLPVAAVLLGLTACSSTPAPALLPASPAVTTPSESAVTTTPATPVVTTKPAKPAATAKPAAAPAAGGIQCPSATALEKLVDLPRGWHFTPSSVECWKGWATADPEGPKTGDGVYLFRHSGTGWRYHSQGSAYDCKDLGIHEDAPFCAYP